MKNTVLLFLVIALLVHIVPIFTDVQFLWAEHIPYFITYSAAFLAIAKYSEKRIVWRWIYIIAVIYPLYDHFLGLIRSIQNNNTVGIIACVAVWIFLPMGLYLVFKRS